MESGRIHGLRAEDLDLGATLQSGQVFRWARDTEGSWRGTVGNRRMRLAQSVPGDTLYWEADGADATKAEQVVRAFLRLEDIDLSASAEEWCRADPLFAEAWAGCPGVRILRQDPEECFFSFLCASVAPVARISRMVSAVAEEAGDKADGEFLAFPSASRLAGVSEQRLRERGLGFRARRVVEVARQMALHTDAPLANLRSASHAEARQFLCSFPGIGAKIADCISLFSLDKDGATPVDTHIWRIARTYYLPDLAGKSLTPANYARIVSAFQDRFGPYAGWAQQILFHRAANRPV
jgi:N-glycosylase/DNA lyase